MSVETQAGESFPPQVFKTLSISPTSEGLLLNGSVVPTADGNIGSVTTAVGGCPANKAPSTCKEVGGGALFTGTSITPVPVESGQQVLVEVEISFS